MSQYLILQEDLSADVSDAYCIDAWRLTYDDLNDSIEHHPIHVCYQYLDLCNTDYGFEQAFCELDAKMYFRIMRCFANRTIYEILEAGGRGVKVDDEGHMVRLSRHDSLHAPLRRQLLKIDKDILSGFPLIFHFGLYTAENGNASRETGIRSPRIYFMMGLYGRIYPLMFDPYHELTTDKNARK